MKDDPPNTTDLLSFRGTRTGLEVEDIKQSFLDHLFYGIGRVPSIATRNDLYTALALTVRDDGSAADTVQAVTAVASAAIDALKADQQPPA